MMRNIAKLLGVVSLMLAAISANAQHTTQVTVPFEFAAAGRILPPGDYRVTFNETSPVVTLRGPDSSSIVLLTAPGDRFNDERNALRFQRNGSEWSLQQVIFAGSVRRLPVRKSKNKEMANEAFSNPAVIEIPLVAFERRASLNEGMN
jgi:hypothetical protein